MTQRSIDRKTRGCVIYTHEACVSGKLLSEQVRFSDTFNGLTMRYLELLEATVTTLVHDRAQFQPVDVAIVSLRDVVVCHPADDEPDDARGIGPLRQERDEKYVVAHAKGGVTVVGHAHLPPNTTLRQFLAQRNGAFLPLTQCHVFQAGGSVPVPFLLVNTEQVLIVYETEQVMMLNAPSQPTSLLRDANFVEQTVASAPWSGGLAPSAEQSAGATLPPTVSSVGVLTRLMEVRR